MEAVRHARLAWQAGGDRSVVFEDDLHAVVGICFEHLNGGWQGSEGHGMTDEGIELYQALFHQVDRNREIPGGCGPRGEDPQFLVIELIERQIAFRCRCNAIQAEPGAWAAHRNPLGNRGQCAGGHDDHVRSLAAGSFAHCAHCFGSAGQSEIGAEFFCQLPFPGATRDSDDRTRAMRSGQLRVQLTGYSETDHYDGLAWHYGQKPLRVNACGEHLDQRGYPAADGFRQQVRMGERRKEIVRKTAVRISPDEAAIAAQVRLPEAAIQTTTAVEARVDHDAIANPNAIVAALNNFTGYLMSHDQGIANGNGAIVNLQVGATNAAICNANQNPIAAAFRSLDIFEGQITPGSEDKCFHRKVPFAQAAARAPLAEAAASSGRIAHNFAQFSAGQEPLVTRREALDGYPRSGSHTFAGMRTAEPQREPLAMLYHR